jgi:Fis family transcriptional regulator
MPSMNFTDLENATHDDISNYLASLDNDQVPENLHRRVTDTITRPILETIMHYTSHDQTMASNYLGFNRATLKTKLNRLDLLQLPTISYTARDNLTQQLASLDNNVQPSRVHIQMYDAVEKPLLELLMRYTRGNSYSAAEYLGIPRDRLRAKLKRHGLL